MSSNPTHQQHIAQWRASGISRAAYCRQHGIVYHTTRAWNKIADRGSVQHADSGFIEVLRPSMSLVPAPPTTLATLSWPTGATLRCPVGTDPQWLGRIIAEVRPC
jgi:hypothetical protein